MNLIAVTQRIDTIKDHNELRDSIDQRLIQFIEECGFLTALVPNSTRYINTWMDRIKPIGIILSGGNNIGDFTSRDKTEKRIIEYSERNKKPLLGICRGMQILANQYGSKLIRVEGHIATRHKIYGQTEQIVNSFHEFAIQDCPRGFEVTSRASDGIIESIKHKTLPWEAIMWHPERETKFFNNDKLRVKNLFK